MALDPKILTQALTELGDIAAPNYPGNGTAADGPGRLIAAYGRYAASATDLAGNPFMGGNDAAARLAMQVALATSQGTAAQAAQALGAAHTAYWTGARFSPGKPPVPGTPGVVGGNGIFGAAVSSVVTAAPATVLVTGLLALFVAPSADAATRCDAAARLWHQVTQMVLVTLTGIDTTPPPAGPLPIVGVGPVA